MKLPEIPKNEDARLKELRRFEILDSEREKDFDDLVELASNICGVPISLISLIDTDRQWYKSAKGLTQESDHRDISFCAHAINDDGLFIVEDAKEDDRFHNNPFVTGNPNIRFYAGMPLKSTNGFNLGSLCVIDSEPRRLTDKQKRSLEILGQQTMNLIELRIKKKEIEEKNRQLQAANEFSNEMTSIISHDVKGPISSLYAYLNTDDFANESNESLKALFPIVKNNLGSLQELVDNLLEWSRRQSDLEYTNFPIYYTAIDVFNLFEGKANEKNNTLKININPNLSVVSDEAVIKFILRNLVNNAVKFTEDGEITIEVKKAGNKALVKVIDTGLGIREDLLKRIKIKDKKITTSGTRNEKGTGLGLRLVREFLSKMDTELEIESKINEGSTFSFTLSLSE